MAQWFPLASSVELPLNASRSELDAALRSKDNKVCFLEITKPGDLDLIPLMLKHAPKLGIVAILASKEQPDLILRCLRLGATDFLIPPFAPEHVETAVKKLIRTFPPDSENSPGKVYCVLPAKGDAGSTTTACNLAFQWKRLAARRVLLADLDPLTGIIAFLLKIKSQYSFADVIHRAADIDADLWKSMVVHAQGIDILLAPDNVVEGLAGQGDASSIIEFARVRYDVVVLDAGGVFGEWYLSQARLSDEVLLVSTNELASVQRAQRALDYLEANGIGRWKVRLVVNRYDPGAGLSQDVISSALKVEIYHTLPSDPTSIQRSLFEGKPIAPSSLLGKSEAALADRLAGREEAAKKSSSRNGLLSLFTRTSS